MPGVKLFCISNTTVMHVHWSLGSLSSCVFSGAPHVFPSLFFLLSPHHLPLKSRVAALGLTAVWDCLRGGQQKFSLDFGILKLSQPSPPSLINQGSPVPASSAKGKCILLGFSSFVYLGLERADHAQAEKGVWSFLLLYCSTFLRLCISIPWVQYLIVCCLVNIYICFYYLLLIFLVWSVPLPLHCVCPF
jgi:hypothetical protein